MDADFRKWIAGKFSSIFPIDQLAEAIEKRALAIFDAGLEQGVAHAKRRELAHRMRQQRDADPELPDFRRTFIDAAGNAALLQI